MVVSCVSPFLKQIDSAGMDSIYVLKIRQDQQDLLDFLDLHHFIHQILLAEAKRPQRLVDPVHLF
jgi:hypothetical protein